MSMSAYICLMVCVGMGVGVCRWVCVLTRIRKYKEEESTVRKNYMSNTFNICQN